MSMTTITEIQAYDLELGQIMESLACETKNVPETDVMNVCVECRLGFYDRIIWNGMSCEDALAKAEEEVTTRLNDLMRAQ